MGLVAAGGNFPVGQAQAVAQALAPGLLYPLGQLGQARFQRAAGVLIGQQHLGGAAAAELFQQPFAPADVFPGDPGQAVADDIGAQLAEFLLTGIAEALGAGLGGRGSEPRGLG